MIIRLILLCLFSFSVSVIYSSSSTVDVVYLTNGAILKGKIIEFEPDSVLSIQMNKGVVFRYSMDEVLRTSKEDKSISTKVEESQFERVPAVSVLLSMVVPGLGQVYNGEYTAGALYFVGANSFNVVGTLLVIYAGNRFVRGVGSAFIGAGVGVWLSSMMLAGMEARAINMKNGFVKRFSMSPTLLPDRQFSTMNAAPGVSLSFRF